jgi:glucokinase
VDRVVEMVRDAMRQVAGDDANAVREFSGVGVGSPGPLDRKTGTVISTPNLGWRNFPLRDLVGNAVQLPATLDNDANAATYGEWWLGAGKGAKVLIGLTLGTGIGGGIVFDGELYHGVTDTAAEIGHMTIDATGRKCKCGNFGCLEQYASGTAIAARAIEGLEAGARSILPEMVGELKEITAQAVFEAVVKGDPFAIEIVKETARFLGAGIGSLINLLNPDRIVIAGGVTRAGDHLFLPLREEVRRRAFEVAVEACQILPAELGPHAGVVGAVACFKRETFGGL